MESIKYSILIPIKDEADSIAEVIAEVESVMQKITPYWEILCINDGSKDATSAVLSFLLEEKKGLSVISLSRNLGQSSAIAAGIQRAKGEWIITLDGDGQNDPHDIPKLLAFSKEWDMVCGRRVKRKDPALKVFLSYFANYVRRKVCGDGIFDTGCSLKVMRASCLKEIKLFSGMHRFLPTLFQMEGFTVKEVAVNHRKRVKGKSKYNLMNRSLNTLVDLAAVAWMRKRSLTKPLKMHIQ